MSALVVRNRDMANTYAVMIAREVAAGRTPHELDVAGFRQFDALSAWDEADLTPAGTPSGV